MPIRQHFMTLAASLGTIRGTFAFLALLFVAGVSTGAGIVNYKGLPDRVASLERTQTATAAEQAKLTQEIKGLKGTMDQMLCLMESDKNPKVTWQQCLEEGRKGEK